MELKNRPQRTSAIMGKARLEAFSDGVIAIIITLMILEIKLPHIETTNAKEIWQQLGLLLPHVIAYALSFVMLGIYWVNHHYFFHRIQVVDSKLLWYNLHFLFWLSLIPLPTTFLAEHRHLPEATAFYGFIAFMCAFAYTLLNAYAGKKEKLIGDGITAESLRYTLGMNWRTLTLYFISIFTGYINTWISIAIFIWIAILYFIPLTFDGDNPATPE